MISWSKNKEKEYNKNRVFSKRVFFLFKKWALMPQSLYLIWIIDYKIMDNFYGRISN